MKAQKYYEGIKQGTVFYSTLGNQLFEWVVTSVRKKKNRMGKFVFIKNEMLGDKYFQVGFDLPTAIYSTKLQALKYGIFDAVDSIEWYKKEIALSTNPEDIEIFEEEMQDYQKDIKVLKSKLTKLRKEK